MFGVMIFITILVRWTTENDDTEKEPGQNDEEKRWVLNDEVPDIYYYISERLKLEGETENMGVWTKKRGSMKAVVLVMVLRRG